MPRRFLKPGLKDSEKWNAVDWPTQSLYVRLISLVDDFGRFEANTFLLRGHAFAMRPDVHVEQVQRMCTELAEIGLVIFYKTPEGKIYLQMTNWTEKPRSQASYFPAFGSACEQLYVKRDANAAQVNPERDTIAVQPVASSSSPPSTSSKASPPTPPGSKCESEDANYWDPGTVFSARKPKDLAECLAMAHRIGLAEPQARQWYSDSEACGWKRGDGTPFENWPRQMCIFRDRLRERGAGSGEQGKASESVQMINRQNELKRVEERMGKIRGSYSENMAMSNEDRAAYKALRERKAELVKLLGYVV